MGRVEGERFKIPKGYERTIKDVRTGNHYTFSWKSDAEEVCGLLNQFFSQYFDLKIENGCLQRHKQDKEVLKKQYDELKKQYEELRLRCDR